MTMLPPPSVTAAAAAVLLVLLACNASVLVAQAGECCYWTGCTSCEDSGTWCSAAKSNCEVNCGGTYCVNGFHSTLDTTTPAPTECTASDLPVGPVLGALTVTIDGTPTPYYVIESGWHSSLITVTDTSLSMQYGNRLYLSPRCQTTMTGSIYEGINVLGGSVSMTVDISDVGCGCNAALYFVDMPGRNSAGNPTIGSCNDYYCDAASVCGVACEELDIMEANTAAFHMAAHSCPTDANLFHPSCGASNCYSNTKYDNTVGPGTGYTINTLLPFRLTSYYHLDETETFLESVETVLEQEGRTLTRTLDSSTDCGVELPKMTDSLERGMTFAMSYWGDSAGLMSWLDIPPCSTTEACSRGGAWTISDMVITTAAGASCNSPAATESECQTYCAAQDMGFTFEAVDADGCTDMCTCKDCGGFFTTSIEECRSECQAQDMGYNFIPFKEPGCENVCECQQCSGVGVSGKTACKNYCAEVNMDYSYLIPLEMETNCKNRCFCKEQCVGDVARNKDECIRSCDAQGLYFNSFSWNDGGSCKRSCYCHTCPIEKNKRWKCNNYCQDLGETMVSYDSVEGCINACVCTITQ